MPETTSSPANLPPATLIAELRVLHTVLPRLEAAPRLALDTESNSLFAYRERVCLIQLSTDQEDFLIDPLAFEDDPGVLDPLGDICANPRIEKVLHAAEYDVMCLRRDFDFEFAHVFDTMTAARILGVEQVGLANLLERHFEISLDKKHQLANWGQRPLKPEQLRYAQFDTHFLLPLRDQIADQLAAGGHLEEAVELFEDVTHARWTREEFDPEGFWRINGAQQLDGQEAAILRELYLLRDHLAQQRNQPVFKIISDSTLIEMVRQQPGSVGELLHFKGLSPALARRSGAELLQALQRGQQAEPLARPRRNGHRAPDAVLRRYDALLNWRKECAAQRGVSSEIVLSKEVLWQLAAQPPAALSDLEGIMGLGPWRRSTYGPSILAVIAASDEAS